MRRSIILLAAIIALLAVIPLWYWQAGRPVNPAGSAKFVSIAPATSSRAIASILKSEGIVRSELAFLLSAKIKRATLHAGVYRLSPADSLATVIDALAQGKVAEYLVTIPEGWRISEIAELLAAKNIVQKTDFLAAAQGKEGYLFPDTYRFSIDVTAETVVKTMRDNLDKRTKDLALTRKDIILASIVEREANKEEDRPKIAAVYLNRLKIGMRLEADPTVQYAKTLVDSTIKEAWPKITAADYRSINSAYNTYLNDGLPPGPICNPGLASLKAVLSPTAIDSLYFFHTSDGQTIYSKTLDEHNAKKKQYNLSI